MSKKTSEEVLRSVSADLKLRGVTHESAARKMGYGSKQTLSNLLSSKKYMSGYQAKKFHDAFGYNMEYLMSGEGELQPYRGVDGSTPLGQVLFEQGWQTVNVIGDSIEGDLQLVLSWVHTLLERQNNKEGLAILTEIYRFTQARDVLAQKLNLYNNDDKQKQYVHQLCNLRLDIVEAIDKMLNNIKRTD